VFRTDAYYYSGGVSVRQELFGPCPRLDEHARPEFKRALASRLELTEYTEHVVRRAQAARRGGAGPAGLAWR
jgi:hypothetical protein